MDKWEYKILKVESKGDIDDQGLTTTINRLGSDGWEVISTASIDCQGWGSLHWLLCVFLKRPRQDDRHEF